VRHDWLIGLILLPAAGLIAFGPRRMADVPADRTIVRYWESWAGVEGQAIQALVDEFNRTVGCERQIHVQYVSLGSMLTERLLVACAGGDPPDMAGLFHFAVPQYAELGALEPLDRWIDNRAQPSLNVRRDEFVPALWDIGVYGGRLYALPSTPFSVALYYNRQLFREAGLDPDRPPQTMAELEASTERLTRFAPDGSIEVAGFLPSPKAMNWWHWFWPYFFGMDAASQSIGSRSEIRDTRAPASESRKTAPTDALPSEGGQPFAIDSPAGLAALRWIAHYRERFGVERTQVFEQGLGVVVEGAQNPFMAGRVAMIHQGPWMANFIERYKPSLDYGVAAFPSACPDGRRPVFVSSDVLVLPKGARHTREAVVFLNWLMRQDVLERLCKAHGKNSPFKAPRDDFFAGHPNPHARMHHELANSPDAFGYPKLTTWPQVNHELLNAVNNVWGGLATPEQAARDTQRRIDDIVRGYERVATRRR